MTAPSPSPARAALGMGVVTAISRGFGFVRVLVIAGVLGATYLGNTFQATNSMSNVLFELLAAKSRESFAKGEKPPPVHLKADKNARYEQVARALFTIQSAGIMEIAFLTEPKGSVSN